MMVKITWEDKYIFIQDIQCIPHKCQDKMRKLTHIFSNPLCGRSNMKYILLNININMW